VKVGKREEKEAKRGARGKEREKNQFNIFFIPSKSASIRIQSILNSLTTQPKATPIY
jgi:hypothetical protein